MNDTQATANPLGYEKIGKLLTSYAGFYLDIAALFLF